MRYSLCTLSLLTILSLAAVTPASATSPVWLDLSAWDHATVTGSGQLFPNVVGTTDLTVTGSAGNSRISAIDSDGAVVSGGDNSSQTFTFTFSNPLPLVLTLDSLDAWEDLVVTTNGATPIVYTHESGAVPVQSGNIALTGSGVGQDPLVGASEGLMDLGTASQFSWQYTARFNDKWERFQVGTTVPEPSCLALASMMGLMLLRIRRR